MQDFIFVEVMEAIDDLAQYLYRFLFSKESSLFNILIQITIIAVLKNQIVIISCFLHIIQFDNIMALTTF